MWSPLVENIVSRFSVEKKPSSFTDFLAGGEMLVMVSLQCDCKFEGLYVMGAGMDEVV